MNKPLYIKREDDNGRIAIYSLKNDNYIGIYSDKDSCFPECYSSYIFEQFRSGHAWYKELSEQEVNKILTKAL